MEGVSDKISPGYGSPPWIFKGSALYQLHLVKADVARSFIPKEVKLVEAFGYTLGGFFLANYDQSPAGTFDELVVIAGIVWNPPTSCAWAARVLVNSDEACYHGRKEVGLPSQVARFSKAITAVDKNHRKGKINGFLKMIGLGTTATTPVNQLNIGVAENKNSLSADICDVNLTTDSRALKVVKWGGLPLTMSLPSFSGRTEYNPNLLKYTCQIQCRVHAVKPAEVTLAANSKNSVEEVTEEYTTLKDCERNASVSSIMLSRPILALKFSSLRMEVEDPVVVTLDNQ